ncbi:rhodanese-like domain-containing protein [Halorubrum lipolyticum]|uniref:Rhodanese n=1 Tax=Halorubrum lipolyticum DSM 21995 TaxID=1227482 RepID=M0P586_9EURY|nr:rhodanese-like domain-containing protein [Halorubrum lipolyticum]EMA64694.1 rhodanese [Halorubrum lipolyticum DSM 21995]
MDGEIDPDELAALLDDAETDPDGGKPADNALRIVDIRDRRAFDRGHVPGSECIPFPELTTRVAELEGAERIVTVCPHGVASKQAAQLIGSYAGTRDARVESLRGGIEGWGRGTGELVPTAAGGADGGADPGEIADEGPDAPF